MKYQEGNKMESFIVDSGNLCEYHQKLTKLDYGMLMFCESGEALITIDLKEYHIVQNTNIFIFPTTIISVDSASDDFKVDYFMYSLEMFQKACFRLEPAFVHFICDNPCYNHKDESNVKSLKRLIRASANVYLDKENRFRDEIAQNLLQIFFLDTYDKVQRHFTPEQINGSNRKEEIFKKFMELVNDNCAQQRDVAWYASALCISTRYLATVVRDISCDNTAKGFIDDYLVLELKVALQTTNLSIKEIADRFNFPDQSFLGRYFKKHTGLSPTEYRQQRQS